MFRFKHKSENIPIKFIFSKSSDICLVPSVEFLLARNGKLIGNFFSRSLKTFSNSPICVLVDERFSLNKEQRILM